jgi:predicted ATP-dependent endonuclease of OLD family
VRLRFEPKSLAELERAYLVAFRAAEQVRGSANSPEALTVWPTNLKAFLDRKLRDHFTVRFYSLDPAQREDPKHGVAKPQLIREGSEPIEGDPLEGLIRVDEISAQRGFTDTAPSRSDVEEAREHRRLSEQLRTYYSKHLDVSDAPEVADLEALQAIENAQQLFDQRLRTGFSAAIDELGTLNYPGITDARLKIATKVRPADGLNHAAAVQYEVLPDGESTANLLLPEDSNGLGYQNLISMVFRLMSFRDEWMRVGKASLRTSATEPLQPLHLVLIEEPEAHLHVQVQQVFLRKAYDVLRKHPDLGTHAQLRTQMIVSTHSSHVAHEMDYACVRYFRRLHRTGPGTVPTSGVVNLSEVFGPGDGTAKFVTRYLRATHCDLFFADAAILVEGPAERMLIPHFIRREFERLHCSYVSLLEIGGSHAHRLRPLIEHLGLTTLVVTDIDSCEQLGSRFESAVPRRNAGQESRNATLRTWHPMLDALDELLDLPDADKIKNSEDDTWKLRVAYQVPVQVELAPGSASEALCTIFEDSLIFENVELFRALDGSGLIAAARRGLEEGLDASDLSARLCEALRRADKGKFALDVLWHDQLTSVLRPPRYISDALAWLQEQLRRQEVAIGSLAGALVVVPTPPTESSQVTEGSPEVMT